MLLVEDNDDLRGSTVELLEGMGLSVLVAADGKRGIEVFSAASGEVDLLITEVVMPGMNGREMAEQLRRLRPELKLLYISGYTADVMLRHGLSEGRVNFLQKPFSASQLAHKIQEVLAQKAA